MNDFVGVGICLLLHIHLGIMDSFKTPGRSNGLQSEPIGSSHCGC